MSHNEDLMSLDDHSTPHVENRQTESSASNTEGQHSQQSDAAAASTEARQRRRIAQLEQKLELIESGRAVKER